MAHEGDPGGQTRVPPFFRPGSPLEEGARWGVRPAHPPGARVWRGRTCWTEGAGGIGTTRKKMKEGMGGKFLRGIRSSVSTLFPSVIVMVFLSSSD